MGLPVEYRHGTGEARLERDLSHGSTTGLKIVVPTLQSRPRQRAGITLCMAEAMMHRMRRNQ
jgi:hypothetical protein